MNISATDVRFDDDSIWVSLSDGRVLGIPLAWFPRLLTASVEQRNQFELSISGIHWDDLDEDISIAGLIEGRGDQTRSPVAAE
ncbi:DUF2442 domain-containing protein [Agrobacterium vitis]|uniref:DUF2442 domain-containing protein n=1 Tax=Agrobacterium vitis TaxID=373 RepID=A0ABD6G577_AGRVI|nr:DUF2442 domain-containing protein [Agrobacterium vitis]MUO97337.1 DUF2442 domain-containing protein [Agrobacterium vitis]MUP03732.1 DUF2442 domain-containing protein [Agrobacterium vitis]MUZ82586.1 DUF2442 domain-containing protein [Agrobacterium vitis]MVA09927.1 DUF2442 domain-containing protein [Agrobacterium vitis]